MSGVGARRPAGTRASKRAPPCPAGRRAPDGSRSAATALLKLRKTGIWHKHRRIAASEAALVALVSLYAPWIQPGHTHAAQTVRLPMAPDHQTLLDGTRAVLSLRELSRKGGKTSGRAYHSKDGGERADDPPEPAPAAREPVVVDFVRAQEHNDAGEVWRQAKLTALDSSNACQLLAVADRDGDFNACHLLSLGASGADLRRDLPTPNETEPTSCEHAQCEHDACEPSLGCISGKHRDLDAAALRSVWGGAAGRGGREEGEDEAAGSVLSRAASKTRPNYKRRRSEREALKFNFNLVFNSVVLGSNALFFLACSWRRWQVSLCVYVDFVCLMYVDIVCLCVCLYVSCILTLCVSSRAPGVAVRSLSPSPLPRAQGRDQHVDVGAGAGVCVCVRVRVCACACVCVCRSLSPAAWWVWW